MKKTRKLTLESLEWRRLLASDLIISEFLASNESGLRDEDGDTSDWIELYNVGTESASLVDFYLTDDADDLRKWAFPSVSLAPGEFLVVYASDKDRTDPATSLHTNFKLGAEGEYLGLSYHDARDPGASPTIVSEYRPTFAPQFEDISYGVTQSLETSNVETVVVQGEHRFFRDPTPGQRNAAIGEEAIQTHPVTFSHAHGFYEEDFSLQLQAAAGATIRYTLDGSEPTTSNGRTYSSSIRIRETTTVRARAFQAGIEPSDVGTATYLFFEDIVRQSPTGRAPDGFPTSTSINGQSLDYGMDPEIVDDATWGPLLRDALTQIPSMSLVMDVDDLLDRRTGIYTNASERGQDWERSASLELIHPDGAEGFQVDAGVRIRGGFSRTGRNPKHAFRLFFRERWGDAKLVYPLFGDEGVDEFDKLDLRTTQNYSWAFQGDGRNAFVRDVFARDLQRAMGQPYTRSRYYHLFINGQYWGLYQSQERAEARFAASYFGGDEMDYDVVKSAGNDGGYENEATDGTLDAYRRLSNLFYQRGGLSSDTAYYRAQGMNLDGTRNPDYERLLDVDNLMDYVLTTYFTGDRDAPVSRFVNGVNNYFGIFNREDPDGFQFFEHDSEHSLDTGFPDLAEQITTNGSQFRYFNPLWMHEQLVTSNDDYRLAFADRLLGLIRPGGVFSDTATKTLIDQRAAEFDNAIIAESARWGDAQVDDPFTKDDWLAAVDGVRNALTDRGAILLEQFRGLGWLPDVEPPTFRVNEEPRHGGPISMADEITLQAADAIDFNTTLIAERGNWKYLDDGSDQGDAWHTASFDDSSWRTGRAQLGYGDGDEATRVQSGPSDNRHITTYFRRTFSVSPRSNFAAVQLRLMRDDGAIVYLNGVEVARSNMPTGNVTAETPAAGSVSGSTESAFFRFTLDGSLLVPGENVIAVEVHQVSPTSSDVSFDLALLGGTARSSRQTIYYTLDGSDPRAADDAISDTAIRYTDDFSLPKSAEVRARSRSGTMWSPLTVAPFEVTDPRLEAVDDVIAVDEGGTASTLKDGSVSVLGNDIGLQNQPVRVTRVQSPAYARLFQLHPDGTFEYEHNGAEVISDSFTYRVTDAEGDSDVATVVIEVRNVSDTTPVAVDDAITIDEGRTTTRLLSFATSVLDNDLGLEDEPVLVSLHRAPLYAAEFTLNEDGSFRYRHDGSETRSDSFAYRITDNDGQSSIGEVPVVIRPVSDAAPLARADQIQVDEGGVATQLSTGQDSVLWNDAGLIDSPIVVVLRTPPQFATEFQLNEDGTFSYQHDGGDKLSDSFSYLVRDAEFQSSIATVQIRITQVDEGKPVAVDDFIQVDEGRNVRQLVDGNRSVMDNDEQLLDGPYSVRIVDRPQNAQQFSLNRDGTFFYQHDGSEVHTDSFVYRLEDRDGDVAEGMVVIAVNPVSDATPSARDDSIAVEWGATITTLQDGSSSVLNNDRRLNDGPIMVSVVTPPQHASSFTLNADGTFEYTHDGSEELSDRFRYRLTDNDGQTDEADVAITVARIFAATDFNQDGVVDILDLRWLGLAVQQNRTDTMFDLDEDGSVDEADVDYMLEAVLRTRRGDTNLDGEVGFGDFLTLSSNFGKSNALWEEGDFDFDGQVGFSDFLVLSSFFGWAGEL